MPAQTEFTLVFEHLKAILTPYAKAMTVKQDTDNAFYLDAPYSEKWKKELYFGSAHIKKNYVSFYFMPVYMHPDLLKGISPDLKKHMQGKSCFNFKTVEKSLFDELKTLVKQGHERFLRENYS